MMFSDGLVKTATNKTHVAKHTVQETCMHAAQPPQPICDNADKCDWPLLALKGATHQSQDASASSHGN